jgi:hypothetical protein
MKADIFYIALGIRLYKQANSIHSFLLRLNAKKFYINLLELY